MALTLARPNGGERRSVERSPPKRGQIVWERCVQCQPGACARVFERERIRVEGLPMVAEASAKRVGHAGVDVLMEGLGAFGAVEFVPDDRKPKRAQVDP